MLKDLYIFGASTNGEQCFKICREQGITVQGFLDNYSIKQEFNGVPILRPGDADRNIRVVVTSPTYALDIWLQIDELGFEVMNMSQFYQELGMEPDWGKDYNEHRAEYGWIGKNVEDTKSVLVFEAILRYRKTLDLFYPASVNSGIENQWFDPEFFTPGPHVFVDGGAYDGDTAAEFIKRCPEYKKVYLFEPSKELICQSYDRLEKYRDIQIIYSGLSDITGKAHLKNAGLPGGKIDAEGEETSLMTLDEQVMELPTFIKLDVEGCELQAIRGAEKKIKTWKPMLAIAVYHRPEDIWQIPLAIRELRPDYKFYLRHYTQFYHETVLYCI